MNPINIFLSVISRAIFIGHGIYTIHLLIMYEFQKTGVYNYSYVAIGLPLIFIVLEMILATLTGTMRQFKYFWPSGFLYIWAMIPIVFLVESAMVNMRVHCRNLGDNFVEEQKRKALLPNSTLQPVIVATYNGQECPATGSQVAYDNMIGITGDYTENALKTSCQLGMFVCIIVTRWFMPLGSMSREQLSTLLLTYIGNSADIIELFETFGQDKVAVDVSITFIVLSMYALACLQFALITVNYDSTGEKAADAEGDVEEGEFTGIYQEDGVNNAIDPSAKRQRKMTRAGINKVKPATRDRKLSLGNELRENGAKQTYINEVKQKKQAADNLVQRGKGKKNVYDKLKKVHETEDADEVERMKRKAMHGDVFQMLVTLLMQDAPFLGMRLYMSVKYQMYSQMHLLFLGKNAFVCIIIVYRLCILTCQRRDDDEEELNHEKASTKLRNVQVAMRAAQAFNQSLRQPDHPLRGYAGKEKPPARRQPSARQGGTGALKQMAAQAAALPM